MLDLATLSASDLDALAAALAAERARRGPDLDRLDTRALLALHVRVSDTLRDRAVLRAEDDAAGTVVRSLLRTAFGWSDGDGSMLTASDGRSVAVRARCDATPDRGTFARFDALDDRPFDLLACVEMAPPFTVRRAVLLDAATLARRAELDPATGSYELSAASAFRLGHGAHDIAAPLAALLDASGGDAGTAAPAPPRSTGTPTRRESHARTRRRSASPPSPRSTLREQLAASLMLLESHAT